MTYLEDKKKRKLEKSYFQIVQHYCVPLLDGVLRAKAIDGNVHVTNEACSILLTLFAFRFAIQTNGDSIETGQIATKKKRIDDVSGMKVEQAHGSVAHVNTNCSPQKHMLAFSFEEVRACTCPSKDSSQRYLMRTKKKER
ncbi:hypothetical protein M514_20017 [Trichuris suis]|uniref:Uncharacterized protein n=1 Tax=Trichuris suis TaxID=68888 RepID=A0A085NE26_9BILA|nr:hypothetical protein M514_20017 [Trichuris suis]